MLVLVFLAGCQSGSQPGSETSGAPSTGDAAGSSAPDKPMSWGPTPAELEQAQELVADWGPAELAGQDPFRQYHRSPGAGGCLALSLGIPATRA